MDNLKLTIERCVQEAHHTPTADNQVEVVQRVSQADNLISEKPEDMEETNQATKMTGKLQSNEFA